MAVMGRCFQLPGLEIEKRRCLKDLQRDSLSKILADINQHQLTAGFLLCRDPGLRLADPARPGGSTMGAKPACRIRTSVDSPPANLRVPHHFR